MTGTPPMAMAAPFNSGSSPPARPLLRAVWSAKAMSGNETMIKDAGGELVAYSVQELGGAWRWRVYGPAGQVISQGVEATEARAMQAAAALMLGAVAARVVRPVAVRGMLAH